TKSFFFLCNFTEVNFGDVIFEDATVRFSDFSNIYGQNGSFNIADIYQSNFSSSNLSDFTFQGSVIKKCNFSEALLKHVSFEDAEISKCNFLDANLSFAVFKGCKGERGSPFEPTQLANAYSLYGAIMPDGQVYNGWEKLKGDIELAKS